MTREELDKRWEEVRRQLREVNSVAILASLFARVGKKFGKKGFPVSPRVIHVALLRLKESDKRYAEMLKDFVYSPNNPAPFPFCEEIEDAIPRLMMARWISVPSPDYDRIVVTEENQKRLAEMEKRWSYTPEQRKLLDEMGPVFARFIAEREAEIEKKRQENIIRS
jgi:hypothetical protein